MTPALSPDIKSIFGQALEQPSPAERAAFLDRACGPNAAVRAEVEGLLAAIDQAGGFLRQPAAPAVTVDPPSKSERAGAVIAGRYKLREQIGEGGMGTVWVAEQTEPVKRRVALKLIKAGLDSRQVQARFEAERQALALMDHPNIARVFDGGVTDEGRPYFVMELVHGVPITRYCDENRLTPRERLELFVPVCQAIQHAHQKGIIHRDIKPTNVLVTHYDDQAAAKVIDFGVAKATEQRLAEGTVYTQYGTMVGTFEYMSPEQAEMNALGVDTRSDIYSLGVLLYELLTGTTPLERSRLQTAALDELIRLIREEEPPLPSVRLSSAQTLASLAASRKMEPARLSRLMRGELDWIVMKCLEKDRKRRYETASGLARDIEHYLRDEPVEACPPSTLYLLQKTANKYRGALATAAGFLALLIAGTAFSAWQAVRATTAEQAARKSERIAQQQRDAATQAQNAVVQEKGNVQAAREELRETLYGSAMNLVQNAMESSQYALATQLLDQRRPPAGQPDPRGFEWHYWKRKLQYGRLRSVEAPAIASTYHWSNTQSFSRHATRLAAIVSYPGERPTSAGPRLLAMVDGLTGRELLAPFDPFPAQPGVTVGKQRGFSMSDDGKRLAVALVNVYASADERPGSISIRDGDTGGELRRMEIPGLVFEIALTPDGKRIAVEYAAPADPRANSGQTGITIWDTSTGELIQTLPMLPWTRFQNGILWSPDGARLLRQSIFSETIENKARLRTHFQIVDAASAEVLWRKESPSRTNPLHALSWSPDGKLLVILEKAESDIAAQSTVQLWDSNTGEALAILDRKATRAANPNIAFSQGGNLLAATSGVNEIYVWDLPKLPLAAGASPLHLTAPRLTLRSGKDVLALAFSADGRELHSLLGGAAIVTWDATARDDAGLGPDAIAGIYARFSADATKLAFSNGSNTEARSHGVWDLAKNQEVCRLKTEGRISGLPVFSPDGRRVALFRHASDPDSNKPPGEPQIVIFDAQTGEVSIAIPVAPTGSLFSPGDVEPVFRPDGKQIAALIPLHEQRGALGPTRLMAWDTVTGQSSLSVVVNASHSAEFHYSQDGASLVLGTKAPPAATAEFYDADTGVRQRSVSMPGIPDNCFINVRHQIFGAIIGSDFVFWNLETGQERLRLPAYGRISYYAISPDGSRLVLGKNSYETGESELTFWSLKSGRQLLAIKREGTVSAISFSPDGNRLLGAFGQSGSGSGAGDIKPIQIWDATPLAEETVAK